MVATYSPRLKMYQSAYDYFDACPGDPASKLAAFLGKKTSTARAWCKVLHLAGSLQRVAGVRHQGGMQPDTFYSIPGKRPTSLSKYTTKTSAKATAPAEERDEVIMRSRVNAVQIGMWRDPLVAALFGTPPVIITECPPCALFAKREPA